MDHSSIKPLAAHLFICTNSKESGAFCAAKDSKALRDRMKSWVESEHPEWKGAVRINASGCLGHCRRGVAAVLYPEGKWFLQLSGTDDKILQDALEDSMNRSVASGSTPTSEAADVFLLHFGGPETEADVKPFLENIFADPFILRAPAFVRYWLGRFIANRRLRKAVSQYESIGYSPINKFTEVQARHLEKHLNLIRPGTKVHVVNRYTAPRAENVLKNLPAIERNRVFLLTLYPHFSHATAGSSIFEFDQFWRSLRPSDRRPMTRVMSWWSQPSFLDYSADLVREALVETLAEAPASNRSGKITVLFSAHGLPESYMKRGDPYPHEIRAHVAELEARMRRWLPKDIDIAFELSFQSRVGPVKWLQPYTEAALASLGAVRGGQLIMVPISFVSDHIETLYEMDVTYRDLAMQAGFSGWRRVRLPNDEERLASCLAEALLHHGL